jgi:hypothetical protein
MFRMASKVSDRLASKFVERVDAGACLPPDRCYCAQQACDPKRGCTGTRYAINCAGRCAPQGTC